MPQTVTVVETVEVEKIVEVTPGAAPMPYAGVEVNVLTFTGPQIAEPLQRRAPNFEALTGAKVNVITVPFADLYQQILTDMATGTNSFDAFVFAPQWMVDYIVPGYLEDLTDRVAADEALEWNDVAPFFRDFSATFEGRTYTIPLDGDFQMVYYRSDLLEQAGLAAPKTWDDYLNIAQTFHGQDLNGDGDPDYGSCIAKARNQQSYWMIISVAGAYLQSQGTSQGAFFNTETFEPLANNAAFARALEVYKATTEYAPPDELNLNVGDTRGLFTSGRCALSLDWGDIGTLAIDPETSTVQDKVGAVILPGSTQVLDRETGELVDCDENTCPYAVDGVNHAPFAAFGGWSGAINAGAEDVVKDAAYDFFSYMSQPAQANEDVTIGRTGFNPYRTSQFLNRQQWVEAGMSPEAASDYLGAIEDSLNSPNMVLDLRIPQNQRYEQVVLDTAISQYLAGELTTEETMQQIYDGWEEITEELGREDQLNAYLASIGAK
jgi:multiple sugar transport system substrate-binding protein